jgi:hypothetical protein
MSLHQVALIRHYALLPYRLGCYALVVLGAVALGGVLAGLWMGGTATTHPPAPAPSPAPVEETPSSWVPGLIAALQTRDRALQEISSNAWTAVLSPHLLQYAAQERLQPLWVFGGMAVAMLNAAGYPLVGAFLGMGGLVVTGRTFPDLWSMARVPTAVPSAHPPQVAAQAMHQHTRAPTYFTHLPFH